MQYEGTVLLTPVNFVPLTLCTMRFFLSVADIFLPDVHAAQLEHCQFSALPVSI